MGRHRRRSKRRRGAAQWADIRVSDANESSVDEFLRFGGPPVFPCGCSAYEAVKIGPDRVGSDAYPTGDGLDAADVERFREEFGEDPVIWWHACHQNENIVLRSPIESF